VALIFKSLKNGINSSFAIHVVHRWVCILRFAFWFDLIWFHFISISTSENRIHIYVSHFQEITRWLVLRYFGSRGSVEILCESFSNMQIIFMSYISGLFSLAMLFRVSIAREWIEIDCYFIINWPFMQIMFWGMLFSGMGYFVNSSHLFKLHNENQADFVLSWTANFSNYQSMKESGDWIEWRENGLRRQYVNHIRGSESSFNDSQLDQSWASMRFTETTSRISSPSLWHILNFHNSFTSRVIRFS
jgi:hypothetical protein